MPELGVEVAVVSAGIQHAGAWEAEVQVVELGVGGFGRSVGTSVSRGVGVAVYMWSELGPSSSLSAPVSAAAEAAGALAVPHVLWLAVVVQLVKWKTAQHCPSTDESLEKTKTHRGG